MDDYQISSENMKVEMKHIISLKKELQELRDQMRAQHPYPNAASIGNVNTVFDIDEHEMAASKIYPFLCPFTIIDCMKHCDVF